MRKVMFGFACATALVGAQTILDGYLDDALWQKASSLKLVPAEVGISKDAGGEIRTAIAGRYVYIAARLPEPTGKFTSRSLGRNPNWEEEDLFRVAIGANTVAADWVIQINPFGACSVEKKGVMVPTDKFLSAARMDGKEWRVEIAVPLYLLNTPPLETIRLNVERVRAERPGMAEQRWRWPELEPTAKISGPEPLAADAPDPILRPVQLGNREPPIGVPRMRELPKASAWNEAAWRDAGMGTLRRNEPAKRKPRFPAEIKLLHDDRTLTVLARCGIAGNTPAKGDSFEVLLATSGSGYARITVDPQGTAVSTAGKTGGSYIARARPWDSHAHAAVHAEPGAWLARIDIPLQAAATILGDTTPPREWRLMFVRRFPGGAGEPPETSVLPVTESATELCPARFRRVLLLQSGARPNFVPPAEQEGDALVSLDTRVFSPAEREKRDLANMLGRQIRGQVRKVLEAEAHDWAKVNSREDWERFREPRLKALAAFFGDFPARIPLQLRVTKEYRGKGYRRQDILFLSRPGVWVAANLYLPERPAGRMPGIVIIHSHHRPRTNAELQDMGILWARLGNAVLIADQAGSGERIVAYPWNREAYNSRYVTGMQLYLAGDSLIKWIVWDTMRAIDVLLERPDIRPDQIILLGAVAAGGDPAAITAALDPRVAAVAPFNFGEATPRFGGRPNSWPVPLSDPGWGSWESTRNLPGSIASQYLPWFICAAVAPRRFIYSYEMGWEVEKQPAWQRYRNVFGFYDALDHLGEAHGFGTFPGPGECTNIGPAQRKTLYPQLERWFGIRPPASEPKDRRPERELAALTPGVAAGIGMREIHEVAREEALAKLSASRRELEAMAPAGRRERLRSRLAAKLGGVEPGRPPEALVCWRKSVANAEVSAIALDVEPGITVPLLLLRPAAAPPRAPVVVVFSEGGKSEVLAQRHKEIGALLSAGIAVCLPDVRGTGETAPDSRRDPSSAEVTLAATELMLGGTLLGARLRDARSVIAYLSSLPDIDPNGVALWGDSAAPANPQQMILDEFPQWRVGPQIQHQAEPVGGLLALLGALYEGGVKAVVVRRGLVAYSSVLDGAFAYVPGDIIVPGMLELADIADIAAVLAPRPLLLESLIDGRNRVLGEAALRSQLASVYASYRQTPGRLVVDSGERNDLAAWLRQHL